MSYRDKNGKHCSYFNGSIQEQALWKKPSCRQKQFDVPQITVYRVDNIWELDFHRNGFWAAGERCGRRERRGMDLPDRSRGEGEAIEAGEVRCPIGTKGAAHDFLGTRVNKECIKKN